MLIIRDQAVWRCNPAAVVILTAAGADRANLPDLTGRPRSELLTPSPALPAPGRSVPFCARPYVGEAGPAGSAGQAGSARQAGSAPVQGLACEFNGDELWLLKPNQSLAELGALAAGLLHNLAGPLSIIRTTAELMARHLAPLLAQAPPPGLAYAAWPASLGAGAERIIEQVDQVTNAARDLLARLRDEAAQQQGPLDLNQILRRELLFLESEPVFRKMIAKQLDLAPDLPPVWGLYSDFAQSFRNLMRNAAQAMAGAPEPLLQISTRHADHELVVEICDTGHGISPADQERLFEPFFTTRTDNGGVSGLGLYSVAQLLKPYQVRYAIASRPGRTSFCLHIPLRPAQGQHA